MLRRTLPFFNTYLVTPTIPAPSQVIHSGPNWWVDPERIVRHKKLYFTLGLDTLPLRRTCVIYQNRFRMRHVPGYKRLGKANDPTGFRKARNRQITLWQKRMNYQEYHLQHLVTRHVFGLLRCYPPGGVKIAGKADGGYFGYDTLPHHRYSKEPLPFPAKELYEPRKL